MLRKRPGPSDKPPVYWWSDGIAELSRNCLAFRRQYQRRFHRADQPDIVEARLAFKAARRGLHTAIRGIKRNAGLNSGLKLTRIPGADLTNSS